MLKNMATPKSSKELFESLRQLRSDPLVAAVLRGDAIESSTEPGGVGLARAREREASPPTRSSYLATHYADGEDASVVNPRELQNVALAHESNQFLRNRDVSRTAVGVGNWVNNHRGEVDAAEARRVENRLKAERTFAQTQLDVEKFRLEHQYRSSANFASEPQPQPSLAQEKEIDAAGDHDESPAKQTQTTPHDEQLRQESPIPAAYGNSGQTIYGGYNIPARLLHAGGDTPLSFLSPFHAEIQRFHSTASPILNTDEVYGPVDEEDNYRTKALSALPLTSHLALSAAQIGEGATTTDLFERNSEVSALRDAVEQRDRTIKRLERQLAQDRDYYEQEVQRHKDDAQEERIANEGRVTALRAQIDQLVSSRAGRNAHETTIEEMTVKLQAVQRMYRESIDDIRRSATARNELLERTCEERIKDITQRAEDAIRQAKEAYRVDRSEYLTSQKDRLVELVQREQNLLLREAESSLKEVVEASVKEKIVTEIELAFRKHLQADILPALRDQIRVDATAAAVKDATATADGVFASKALELRNLLQEHCVGMQASMTARFQTTAEHILRTTVQYRQQEQQQHSDATQESTHIPISSQTTSLLRQSHATLNEVLTKTVAEDSRQAKLEDLHGEKMAVYRRRMAQLEGALESEMQFADAIRQQVAQTSIKTDAPAPRAVHHPEQQTLVAPPWVGN